MLFQKPDSFLTASLVSLVFEKMLWKVSSLNMPEHIKSKLYYN